MEKRAFGRHSGKVTALGFGAWGIGGGRWKGATDNEAIRALEQYLTSGGNFIDTAHSYGNGHSEELIARVRQVVGAQEVFIATKIPPLTRQWPIPIDAPLKKVFPHDHVWRCTEQSLERLKLNTIFLQQYHVWTDRWAEDEYWMRTVDDLKRQRLIEFFGVSVNDYQPDSALSLIQSPLIDSVQVMYNLFEQRPDDKLLPEALRRGVAVIARQPLDTGLLTGLVTPATKFEDGDWRRDKFTSEVFQELEPRLRLVAELAKHHGVEMTELALRFALNSAAVTSVIPGMRSPQHVQENTIYIGKGALPEEAISLARKCRWDR